MIRLIKNIIKKDKKESESNIEKRGKKKKKKRQQKGRKKEKYTIKLFFILDEDHKRHFLFRQLK